MKLDCVVKQISFVWSCSHNLRMGDICSEFPPEVPSIIRSDKPSHCFSETTKDSIYTSYTVMLVNTGILEVWWKHWCDTINYPDTRALLDFIYIDNDFPWFSAEFEMVVDNFRRCKKMLPLLRDDFVKLILPQIYVAFTIQKIKSQKR